MPNSYLLQRDGLSRGNTLSQENMEYIFPRYNAGPTLIETAEYSIHARTDKVGSSGRNAYNMCNPKLPGLMSRQYWSFRKLNHVPLVVVLNRHPNSKLTKEWLWNELFPTLKNVVKSKCQNTNVITTHFYIKGVDANPYTAELFRPEALTYPKWSCLKRKCVGIYKNVYDFGQAHKKS